MSDAILKPTKAAHTAVRFRVRGAQLPARLSVTGLGANDSCALRTVDGGRDGVPVIPQPVYRDGQAVTLKQTEPVFVIYAPGQYELDKPATAADAGVFLNTGD